MRISQPTGNNNSVPYFDIGVQGCSDTTIGFDFLSEQPKPGKRRYCNKVLVHECYSVPEPDPIELLRVEFLATNDPCYALFNVFKSSDAIEDLDPTIEIQTNLDGEAIGVLLTFSKEELCCLPLAMAYRMYGYIDDDNRVLLANGVFYTTPCNCAEIDEVPGSGAGIFWTDVDW